MKVIKREQCPQCLDSGRDNLVIYEDGHSHCFACNLHTHAEGEVDKVSYSSHKPQYGLINATIRALETRGITEKTCQFYDYGVGNYHGTPCHVANYKSQDGETVAQKLRLPGKKMPQVGDSSKITLYGKWLFKATDRVPVVVTEGELDALSVAQVFGLKYPVVSVPFGAGNAKEALRKELEWLSAFQFVILCFDQDEPGRAAMKECSELFEPGKVKVVRLPAKDPNELLVAGRGKELKEAIWNAEVIRPEQVITVDEAISEALIRPEKGLSWPWESLTNMTYGIHSNSIYTLGAGSGIGKTEFLKDLALHLVSKHGAKVGAMFLESTPAQILLRLAGGVLGKRLHVPGDEWNEAQVKEAMESFKDNLFFYDPRKGYDVDSVLNKIRYMVKGLGVKYIILDHLTALAAGMPDERKGLDDIMSKLGGLVHVLDCTIFLVSHLSKPEGKSYEEGRRVTASAFRGSQSIQYWSTFMLGLERDKLAEIPEERQVTTVRVLKDRFTGEADGETFQLHYNRATGRLEEQVEMFKEIL